MKKELLYHVIDAIEQTGLFMRVYKNVAPVWTKVKAFPSAAVVYDTSHNSRENISTSRVRAESTITVYLYAKQKHSDDYEDITSDLVEAVESAVNAYKPLQDAVIDCLVADAKQDAGMLHPISMVQININLSYLKLI